MKKTISLLMACALAVTLAGCSKAEGFDKTSKITVISREDGSGTRGAFIELFGIQEKNAAGEKIDRTTDTADITQSTGVMLTSVTGNDNAIGYISLGSLNDTVKALKIDGADATVANVESGDYKISRPFNIATKSDVSAIAQDFISYILSADGQKIVKDKGYIPVSAAEPYAGTKQSGKITVAGSSSVTPVMEKLKEGYEAINPDATVEINQSDSTTGMNSTIDGVCDIGMASRAVSDNELTAGLTSSVIATDGIAVIVNKNNPASDLTVAQVQSIYIGEATAWSDIIA